MSLVGTRPPTVDEWDKYELHHRARLATKPGLTGMWQVSGRSNITDFGDRVLVAQMNWNGMLEGAVYGFVEDPEEGWSPIECRLELLKISDETYTDAGHVIEWCIKNAH